MTSLRIFFIGGLTSYRALFNWLTPWILIPCVGLTFVGILLMVWQPRWTRPPWLRRYQEDIRPRSADA